MFWSLLQLQPAPPPSVQFDKAKCDRAVPANTRAASQGGDVCWNPCGKCMQCMLNPSY